MVDQDRSEGRNHDAQPSTSMIVKSKTRKNTSFWQAIQYVLREDAHPLFTMTHNLDGDSPESWTASFFSIEGRRRRKRKNAVKVMHIILSWHAKDSENLTEHAMKAMTREFMQLYNPHSAYVAVAHAPDSETSSGPHVHIIASGVDRFGRSIRLSTKQFQAVKVQAQQFQEKHYPELTHSINDHSRPGRNRVPEREYWLKRQGKQLHKEHLAELLKTTFEQAHSYQDFIDRVQSQGLKTYDRGGRTIGLLFEGRKYRFTRFGYTRERLQKLDRQVER